MTTTTFLCSITILLTIFDCRIFSANAEKVQEKQLDTYDTNNPMVCVCRPQRIEEQCGSKETSLQEVEQHTEDHLDYVRKNEFQKIQTQKKTSSYSETNSSQSLIEANDAVEESENNLEMKKEILDATDSNAKSNSKNKKSQSKITEERKKQEILEKQEKNIEKLENIISEKEQLIQNTEEALDSDVKSNIKKQKSGIKKQKTLKKQEKNIEASEILISEEERKRQLIKKLKGKKKKKKVCKPSKWISFVGINSKGKTEIVSLEPIEEKCTIPNFEAKSKNLLIQDLDESIYVYDGNLGIYNLKSKNGSWGKNGSPTIDWDPVTALEKPFSKHAASLTFSDGSWWMTGGMENDSASNKKPSKETTFFDKVTGHTVSGRKLKWPQAGHCMVEAGKTFVSAGGYQGEDLSLSGFTQLYNITEAVKWEQTNSMNIPRRGHTCVSITTKNGEELMAIGGLDRPSIVTIGCKVYLITMGKKGFGVIYILTETRWKLLHYKSKFSEDMINGSFASSPLHCSDFQQI